MLIFASSCLFAEPSIDVEDVIEEINYRIGSRYRMKPVNDEVVSLRFVDLEL